MTCLHCAKNRAVRATDGFYSARCRRGYPHQDEGCAGFVGRSTGIEDEALNKETQSEVDIHYGQN